MIRGRLALIGSGELSATMVETHKRLFSQNRLKGKTVFLDTPAGFQGNVDILAQRAADFFQHQVGQKLEIASFKSAEMISPDEAEAVFHLLGEANYVLIGPGSPTYTVRQLKDTPIPTLLSAIITKGGTLVLASAAALTAGSHTLPVYEIYKVGEKLNWFEGLNILNHFGLDLVVIPHWNNAEGGNHDTRFCYMGEERFEALEQQLPPDKTILGIDEHTACILDFAANKAYVEGLGSVTIRRGKREISYQRHQEFTFDRLTDTAYPIHPLSAGAQVFSSDTAGQPDQAPVIENRFWQRMHEIEASIHSALKVNDLIAATTLLLEADQLLWQAQLDLEDPEMLSQGRELYREMIVLTGTGLKQAATNIPRKFDVLVKALIELREQHRNNQRWLEADQIRAILQETGLAVEDTVQGPRWYHL